ncbi:MAG: tRNA 2-thiocytidine biosynthesis TtcA family protein [Blautia sp.]|nr:tRNA 2-thiocytidine biosynthesis TtcA family protein [Blautia sp.]
MKLQQLYSLVRQAVQDYRMIAEGDRIAIGISGGKDSLTLLYALAGLRRFYPISYELVAITVDLGFEDMDFSKIRKLCETLDVEYHIVSTDIGRIVFEEKKDSSHCSLCAKMRKGALNQRGLELGCNKIAYAHHKDDMVETALLSLFYEGRFYCFPPVTHLDHTGLTVIRPLMYVRECEVLGFSHKYKLPVVYNTCPADGAGKRTYIKRTLCQLMEDNPEIKKHIFHAIQEAGLPDWPDKI